MKQREALKVADLLPGRSHAASPSSPRVPIRIKAAYDELPDDVPEVICDFELKLQEPGRPYALQ